MSTNSFSKCNRCLNSRILRKVLGILHPSVGFINMFIAWPGDRFLLCTLKGYWELMDRPFSKTKFPNTLTGKFPCAFLVPHAFFFISSLTLQLSDLWPSRDDSLFLVKNREIWTSHSQWVWLGIHSPCPVLLGLALIIFAVDVSLPLCLIVSMLGNKYFVCSWPQCTRQLLPYYTSCPAPAPS